MSSENHLFPSRFEATVENVALAIEHAKASTPELKWGACDIEKKDWEEVLGRMTGPAIYSAWCGPTDAPFYAAVTGNGPTSAVNALFFAHARDIVIKLGEEWQRLKELADLVESQFVPIIEMDDEANDPSKDLYIALHRVKVLLDATRTSTKESG